MQLSAGCLSELLKWFVVDVRVATSSLTGLVRRWGLLSALMTAGFLACGTVDAGAVTNVAGTIEAQLSPMLDSLTQASVSVVKQDRATASTQAELTLSLASGLLATIQSSDVAVALGGTGRTLQKRIFSFQNQLVKAKALVNKPTTKDSAALKAMLKVVAAGQRLRKIALAAPASDTVIALAEVAPRAVALHYSGDVVCFHVSILDGDDNPACSSADVSVANVGGDSSDLVVMGSPLITSATDFCLTMGPDAGTLRVTVTMCGQSSSILVYNYGVPKKKGPELGSPQDLAAEASTVDTIQLAWSYDANGVDGFQIERSVTGDDPWTPVGVTDNSTTAYVDSGLAASATYFYRARAYNAKGYSGYSNTARGRTVSKTDQTPPSTPSGLNATIVSSTEIDLTWGAAVDTGGSGLHGYQIFRDEVLVATTSNTSYSCLNLAPGTQYCFTITAYDNQGNVSVESGPVCVVTLNPASTPPGDTTAPTVPAGLIAAADSTTQVTVRWNASTDSGGSGLAGYRVYRNGTQVATTAGTSYSDGGLAPATEYCYTVVAFDGAGNASSTSAQAWATTLASASDDAPAAPSNLAATAVSATEVTLTWQDNSDDELGFQIERALSADGPWSLVGATAADETSYSDIGLAPSTTYYYRVSAFN
ncbi:MAG TPA: fibronectin type III domain-containing protein [Verrucomicrobiae bacterium]|nr:fibronectin type III domain-containing protein [Verrucomicrobiae bacterium]